MNENLVRLIEMLEPKAKRMTQQSIIESLLNLDINKEAKVDFEVSKKAITINIESKLGDSIEFITYTLKHSKN